MYQFFVGEYGISPEHFWDLTPNELSLIVWGKLEAERHHAELLERVVAFGYGSAKKGKMIKMFPSKLKEQGLGHVTEEVKNQAGKKFSKMLEKVVR